jgi:hypothetical protein
MPNTPGALTKVEIVTTQSHLHPHTGQAVDSKTVKLVNTRRTLEEAIIARNKHHFAQADGTPFTRPLSHESAVQMGTACTRTQPVATSMF